MRQETETKARTESIAAAKKELGFYRIREVLSIIPVSSTSWYEGINKGIYPAPVKISSRSSAWRVEDIHSLVDELGGKS